MTEDRRQRTEKKGQKTDDSFKRLELILFFCPLCSDTTSVICFLPSEKL